MALPSWAIILIVVGSLGLIGGLVYWFFFTTVISSVTIVNTDGSGTGWYRPNSSIMIKVQHAFEPLDFPMSYDFYNGKNWIPIVAGTTETVVKYTLPGNLFATNCKVKVTVEFNGRHKSSEAFGVTPLMTFRSGTGSDSREMHHIYRLQPYRLIFDVDASIAWGDSLTLQYSGDQGTTWSDEGKVPVIPVDGNPDRIQVIWRPEFTTTKQTVLKIRAVTNSLTNGCGRYPFELSAMMPGTFVILDQTRAVNPTRKPHELAGQLYAFQSVADAIPTNVDPGKSVRIEVFFTAQAQETINELKGTLDVLASDNTTVILADQALTLLHIDNAGQKILFQWEVPETTRRNQPNLSLRVNITEVNGQSTSLQTKLPFVGFNIGVDDTGTTFMFYTPFGGNPIRIHAEFDSQFFTAGGVLYPNETYMFEMDYWAKDADSVPDITLTTDPQIIHRDPTTYASLGAPFTFEKVSNNFDNKVSTHRMTYRLSISNDAMVKQGTTLKSSDGSTLTVSSTIGFPTAGKLSIQGATFQYTGITATTFTGVTGNTDSLAADVDVLASNGDFPYYVSGPIRFYLHYGTSQYTVSQTFHLEPLMEWQTTLDKNPSDNKASVTVYSYDAGSTDGTSRLQVSHDIGIKFSNAQGLPSTLTVEVGLTDNPNDPAAFIPLDFGQADTNTLDKGTSALISTTTPVTLWGGIKDLQSLSSLGVPLNSTKGTILFPVVRFQLVDQSVNPNRTYWVMSETSTDNGIEFYHKSYEHVSSYLMVRMQFNYEQDVVTSVVYGYAETDIEHKGNALAVMGLAEIRTGQKISDGLYKFVPVDPLNRSKSLPVSISIPGGSKVTKAWPLKPCYFIRADTKTATAITGSSVNSAITTRTLGYVEIHEGTKAGQQALTTTPLYVKKPTATWTKMDPQVYNTVYGYRIPNEFQLTDDITEAWLLDLQGDAGSQVLDIQFSDYVPFAPRCTVSNSTITATCDAFGTCPTGTVPYGANASGSQVLYTTTYNYKLTDDDVQKLNNVTDFNMYIDGQTSVRSFVLDALKQMDINNFALWEYATGTANGKFNPTEVYFRSAEVDQHLVTTSLSTVR